MIKYRVLWPDGMTENTIWSQAPIHAGDSLQLGAARLGVTLVRHVTYPVDGKATAEATLLTRSLRE